MTVETSSASTTSPLSVLITGAAGFLGSNLVERLLNNGHRVIGIDDLSKGRLDNLGVLLEHPAFDFHRADMMDPSLLDSLPGDPDVLVHLAAFKIPRYGNAIDTLKINYQCTVNVLDHARERGQKVVLASTSDVYGMNPELPFSETGSNSVIGSSRSPRWAYAVSKLHDEHLAFAYQDAYDFPVCLLRFFGSYGPRQHLSWWGGPPPVFIEAILADTPIPIHGDGEQTRSFTFVSDTIDGIEAAITRDDANGEVLNIGYDEEVTIIELARRIKALSDTPGKLKVDWVPYESFSRHRYEDVRRRVPDTELSARILGVKAQTSLDEGLVKTIAWQKQAMRDRSMAT